MEIYFDNLERTLKKELSYATESVKVVVGWLDFCLFEQVFIELKGKNVEIEIIVEDHKLNHRFPGAVSNLKSLGVKIKFQRMISGNFGHMHHKFCIIDSKTIINGSYNWTFTANNYSFENFIIIRDNREAIDKFSDEFDVIKHMTSQRLSSIQYLKNCKEPECNGKMVNLLIYGPHVGKYGETVGDIIELCSENPYEHFKTIELSVIDNTISRIAEEVFYRFETANNEFELTGEKLTEEKIAEINRELDYATERRYMIYSNNYSIKSSEKNIIHGWGKILSYPMYNRHEDPGDFVKIYWKDRFVKDKIEDEYEDTFDLY